MVCSCLPAVKFRRNSRRSAMMRTCSIAPAFGSVSANFPGVIESDEFYTMVDHPKSRSLLGPGYGDAELVWRHFIRHVRWSYWWPRIDSIRKHRTGERPFRLFPRITPHLNCRTLRSSKPSTARHPILLARAWPTPLPYSSPP